MSGRQKIVVTNGGTPQLYHNFVASFRQKISSTNTDVAQLLLTLSHYSRTIDLYSAINHERISFQAFAVSSYSLLTNYQPFPIFKTDTIEVYEDSRALAVTREAEAVREYWTTIVDPQTKMAEAKLSLLRTIADNGLFQQEVIYKVANTLVLAGLKPFRNLGVENNDVEFIFRKHLGISAYDYYLLLFSLWINSERTPIFNIRDILKNVRRKKEIIEFGIKICRELSKKPVEFGHSQLNTQFEKISVKFRGSAYFGLHPLISIGNDFFSCIAHPFLRTHVTSKFIQKGLALARVEEPDVDGRTKLSQFIGGHRLEAFFKELCDEWAPEGGHYDEFVYSEEMKSSDRIIFEQVHGTPFLTLVQLKLKALPTSVHYAESWDIITKDFATSYADCIFKSIKFLYSLEKAHNTGRAAEQHKFLTEKILANEHHCFVGIVPDLPPIFNISYARQTLEAQVASKLSKNKALLTWFQNKFPDGYLWHIMDLTEFQFILSAPKGTSLAEEVCHYVNTTGVDEDPFRGDDTIPPPFKNFLIDRYGTNEDGRGKRIRNMNARLQSLFIETKNDVGYFLFKPFYLRLGRQFFFWNREKLRIARAYLDKYI